MGARFSGLLRWLVAQIGEVVLLEALIVIALLAIACLQPNSAKRFFEKLERMLGPVLQNARTQLVAVALLAFALRAAFLPWIGPPDPVIHDEYSLLLQGQTFASGRLTNPAHPLWIHFESPHVSQQPTYSSPYFPGRGFPIAVGYLLGHPWIGWWISVVAMCVAICWMLQGWVPLPYAFVGGVLAVLRFAVFSYWINSYWGGATTALGGALVLGALPRIMQRVSVRNATWLGLGVLILMTTRPYEAVLFCIPVALALLWWMYKERPQPAAVLTKLVLPASVWVALGAAVMLVHAAKVTGHATLTPYGANRQMYAIAPAFLFLPLSPPPEYRHDRMRRFYEWEAIPHKVKHSVTALVAMTLARVRQFWTFYIGPALTIPFLLAIWMWGRRARFLAAAGLFFFLGYVVETWALNIHYASPVTGLVLVLIVIGLQRLRPIVWRGRPVGLFLSRALPVTCLIVLLAPAGAAILGWPKLEDSYGRWCCKLSDVTERGRITTQLSSTPGQDLVLVRYAQDYSLFDDWVYNDADIDRSSIVWALDLGSERNGPLLEHFKGRKVWTIELAPGTPPNLTLVSSAP